MGQVWEWITGGIGHLLDGLKLAAAGIVGRILATFGLTMVSFKSILPNLRDFIAQYTSGLSAEALNFIGAIGLGQGMSMILSALTIRMAWKVFIVPKSVADAIGAGS